MAALVIQNNERFSCLGEQLFAIRTAAETFGHRVDPRLTEIQRRAASISQPAGASEQIPSDGGFLVAPEYTAGILERVYQTGELIRRFTKFPTKTNALAYRQFAETARTTGSRLGGLQVYRQNEAQSLQVLTGSALAQKPTVALNTLTLKKYTGLMYCTDELDMDSNAFGTWATYAYSTELAFCLELDAVQGTGAGELAGVLNSNALVTAPSQFGQPAHGIIAQNAIDMAASLWAASRTGNKAIWLYNQNLGPTLWTLTITVGNAGSELPLWSFQSADNDYDRLCGIPAVPSEYCSAPGTLGDIVLADWSRYAIAFKDPMIRGEVSIHVEWLTNQSAFRWIMRVDGGTIDIAPVTPLFGSQATSPFVSLAAR